MTGTIGIDLGTTYCAVATINSAGQAEIMRNSDGQAITPSVVLFDNGEAIVGQQAKLQRAAFPDDVVEFVKRQMGSDSWRFYPTVGDPYSPEGISAVILKRLAADTSLVLGEAITQVVITVPAYFDDAQRKATKDAGEIAGLTVLSVINEPTAAAVSFGVEHDFAGTVLVYDLGGGTFDVTLLRARDGNFDIVRTDGDRNLGGFDFDNAVIQWIKEEFASQTGEVIDDGLDAQLRDRAEQAKHRLSMSDQAPIFVSAAGRNEKLILSRSKFEEITSSLLARTEMLVEDVVDGAGIAFDAIDKVLLVGGSTRMPMVARALTQLTGRRPDQSIHPDEAVAKGAAIVAALRDGGGSSSSIPIPVTASGHAITISDVVSHGLGVVTIDDSGREVNSLIITANAKIPCQRTETFFTVAPHQTELNVRVTEGDDLELRYVKSLGASQLKLQGHAEEGSPIQVTFSCDIDGILHIEVVDLVDGKSLGEFEIDRAKNLDQEQIDRMRDALSNLDVQ